MPTAVSGSFPWSSNDEIQYDNFCKKAREEAAEQKKHPLYPEYKNYLDKKYTIRPLKSCSVPLFGELLLIPPKQKDDPISFKEFIKNKKWENNVRYTVTFFFCIAMIALGFLGLFYFNLNIGI